MTSKPHRKAQPDPIVDAAAAKHGADIVSIFHALQAERGYLSADTIGAVATALKLPDRHAFGVATFYSMFSTQPRSKKVVRVCDSPACRLKGSAAVHAAIETAAGGEWAVERTSCLGLCDRAPAALVGDEACGPLSPDRARAALSGWRGEYPDYTPALPGEVRVTLARLGQIDPDSIDSAIAAGAYQALKQALGSTPSDVVNLVEASGLQGRGGAGFPVGRKWKFVAQTESAQKYIVCNFDESEPGTFKDRVVVDADPQLVIEGMALAGFAVGANAGYLYIRGEYEWIARRLERAIAQAEARGWLGENIQGSSFSFRLHVHRGAGAYICGEETALLESLEGRRGEPRIRPPYPTTQGYLGQPTVVNNVESLCSVPAIVLRGAEWYRSLGIANSPGVKLFSVFGHVRRPSVFEAPFGLTLRQIIDQFGGGMRPGSSFKMALTGGAAGTIVPAELLDVPLDFASARQGLALGSGAMFILDESASAVTLLYGLLHFFESESCGKCTPCREGTRQARLIVERIANGQGRAGDVAELQRLANLLRATAFCGLGQSVAMPLESTLEHFGHEFA
ncbi:MAG TPA: NADH-quinone oxidoreductase subunit NuoF [Anaerolineae bacterium]|nr:NADH-quinone oxidoreductase subunit NuoF [Anaerolineae bacterium]